MVDYCSAPDGPQSVTGQSFEMPRHGVSYDSRVPSTRGYVGVRARAIRGRRLPPSRRRRLPCPPRSTWKAPSSINPGAAHTPQTRRERQSARPETDRQQVEAKHVAAVEDQRGEDLAVQVLELLVPGKLSGSTRHPVTENTRSGEPTDEGQASV